MICSKFSEDIKHDNSLIALQNLKYILLKKSTYARKNIKVFLQSFNLLILQIPFGFDFLLNKNSFLFSSKLEKIRDTFLKSK